jgi:hypothetical protein
LLLGQAAVIKKSECKREEEEEEEDEANVFAL